MMNSRSKICSCSTSQQRALREDREEEEKDDAIWDACRPHAYYSKLVAKPQPYRHRRRAIARRVRISSIDSSHAKRRQDDTRRSKTDQHHCAEGHSSMQVRSISPVAAGSAGRMHPMLQLVSFAVLWHRSENPAHCEEVVCV